MECDDPSSETQLSDWSDQETKFEADDEQSDFFEASLTNLNIRQKKSGGSGSGLANRTMMLRTNPTNMNGFARTNGSASGSTCSRNPFIANTSNSHHHHLHHAPSHASCSTSGMSTAVWKKRRKNLENKLYS